MRGRACGAGAGPGWGYLPHLYTNDFWLLGHHLVALNASLADSPAVPLAISYSPASMWRWALQSHQRARAGGGDAIHEALLAALRARPVAG